MHSLYYPDSDYMSCFRKTVKNQVYTHSYHFAMPKRFEVLWSLYRMVKTTQLIPQTKRNADFMKDGSNHAEILH